MSVPTSHLVLFIASIAVAAGVAGAFTAESSRMSATIEEVGLDISGEVETDIEIVSDAGAEVYDDDNVTLAIQNMGDSTLPHGVEEVDVFLNGEFQPESDLATTVMGASAWAPDTVVRLTILAPDLAPGDHRVKVVVDGDAEVFEFHTCAGGAVTRSRIIFEHEGNSTLAMMNRSGDVINLGTSAKGFSEVREDFDCDGLPEAAYSLDGDDRLYIIDRNGETERISDDKGHDRRLGAGDVDADGEPDVIFANRNQGDDLYRTELNSPDIEIGNDIDSRSIGGLVDFNGDGDLDLVFLQGGGDLVYLDNQTVFDTGVDARNDQAIGTPGDFGDGVVRVPIYLDEDGPIRLVDHTGDMLIPPNQPEDLVDKGSLATIDWDQDGDLDVLFQHKDDNKNLWRIDADGNLEPVLDSSGQRIPISDDGVA